MRLCRFLLDWGPQIKSYQWHFFCVLLSSPHYFCMMLTQVSYWEASAVYLFVVCKVMFLFYESNYVGIKKGAHLNKYPTHPLAYL